MLLKQSSNQDLECPTTVFPGKTDAKKKIQQHTLVFDKHSPGEARGIAISFPSKWWQVNSRIQVIIFSRVPLKPELLCYLYSLLLGTGFVA